MRKNIAVDRAMDVLNLIAERKEALTTSEVSRILCLPKSSVFEILYTLVNKGYLEIDNPKNKDFKLGLKAFRTGIAYINKTDLCKEAKPLLEEMVEKTQETGYMVRESEGRVVYIDKVRSSASNYTFSTLGTINPMHCTGVGKALLAAFPVERVKEIVKQHGLSAKTEHTITDYYRLSEDLEQTRNRGYAIDNLEGGPEVFCVAAPVYDMSAKPIAAISIACLATRMLNDPERVQKFGQLVSQTAMMISRRLGFRGVRLFP